MGVFKKASKYRKPLSELKIKEDFLNQELKRTGMLSEKMTTSKMYYDVASHTPAVEAILSDVPDPNNIRVNGSGNASDIDPSNPSTWANGGNSINHLLNTNTLPVTNGDDVSNQPVLATPDVTGFAGLDTDQPYAGIFGGAYWGVWGTSYGVIGAGNKATIILPAFGWPNGSAPGEGDRAGFSGQFRADSDATYNARRRMVMQVQSYGSAWNDNNNWKTVKAWVDFNSYGFGQTWTQYKAASGTIWREGDDGGGGALLEAYVSLGVYVGHSNNYTSTVATPKSIILRANEGLGDPGFFPGPIQSWLMNKLKLAKQGSQYLLDKIAPNNKYGVERERWSEMSDKEQKKLEATFKDFGEMDKSFTDRVGDWINKFKSGSEMIASIPTGKGVMDDFLKAQKTNDHNPDHPDYKGPMNVRMSQGYKNEINKRVEAITSSLNGGKGPVDPNKLNDAEIEALSNKMKEIVNGRPHGGWAWYNIMNSLPVNGVTTVERGENGRWNIDTNYLFTDRDDDVSAFPEKMSGIIPPFIDPREIITNKAKKNTNKNKYSQKFTQSETDKTVLGYLNNTQINLQLSYEPEGEVLSEGWQSPEHVNVDKDERKRWFKEKDILPEYPKKAPPKQVNGWHPSLVDKPIDNPTIKITKDELIRNHRLTDAEVKEWTDTINALNAFIDAYPEELIHARQRYPVSDPRLAELNWKMDTMLGATEEFLDKKYPENTRLFNQLQKSVTRSIKLTDPTTFKVKLGKETSYKKLLNVDYITHAYSPTAQKEIKVKVKQDKDKKKTAARFFRKERKKSKSEILDLRIKQLDIDMSKTLTNP